MSIGTNLSRHEHADASGTHPAGKRLGVDTLRVEPRAHLPHPIFPRLVIQMWWGRDHWSFHFSNVTLGSWPPIGTVCTTRHAWSRTVPLSNGRLAARPLTSAKSRRFIGQPEF